MKLKDKYGKAAGNIDLVLVSYDGHGKVLDFGSVEVQAVYITGNVRKPFAYYMQDPKAHADMNWKNEQWWPGPDYLSSSRKRLAPQLIFKGGIFNAWRKKTAVALDAGFFANLPKLKEVPKEKANMAWFVYDLEFSKQENFYNLKKQTVYTGFKTRLTRSRSRSPVTSRISSAYCRRSWTETEQRAAD